MQTIQIHELEQNPQLYKNMAKTLHEDGIVCLPASNGYRLVANIFSLEAVVKILQIKRRTRKAPVLLFVPDQKSVHEVAADVSSHAQMLMQQFWPGDLTLLFDAHNNIPKKVRKNLSLSQIGVRIPRDPCMSQLVEAFGGPLLVTSANKAKKVGAHSEAQIRKNFSQWLDILVSAGDVKTQKPSTIVDVRGAAPTLRREGAIEFDQILQAWETLNPLPQTKSSETIAASA